MRKEGNNPYNNRVLVDYEKKTIKFIPIGKKGVKKYYFMFLFNIFTFYLLIVFYPLMIISLLFEAFFDFRTTALVFGGLFQIILLSLYFSSWFYRKEWRKKYYPELNYRIINVYRFFKKKKGFIVEPKAIIDNKFIVPYFKNVKLSYKSTGDFAKYLKKVSIVNLWKANPCEWNCVFEFSKKPLIGKLELDFI